MAIQKQTGLIISRSGNDVTLEWKPGQAYDSQEAYWNVQGNKVITTLSGDAASITYTIPLQDYYPNTKTKLPSVQIYVRGCIDGKYSAWASATYKFLVPNKPVAVNESLVFSWDVNDDYIVGKGDPYICDVEYQRVNSTSGTEKKVQWQNGGSSSNFEDVTGQSKSGTLAFTETPNIEWFRVCARGLNGQSAWAYACHIVGVPFQATGVSGTLSGTNITAKWTPKSSPEKPIEYQYVQYCFATPTSEDAKGIPICPDGVTWITAVDHIIPTAKTQSFSMGQRPPVDKCVWIRIGTTWKNDTIQSDPVYVGSGLLVSPTIVSITVDEIARNTVIVLSDNSTVSLTKIAVINSTNKILATAAHGTTTITVNEIPTQEAQIGIKVYQGASAVKPNMYSDNVFSTAGDVPLAPTNVVAVATEKNGVVSLSWDIPWTDATGAEVSWADHDDAWMSTEGPKTFAIDQRATEWNIAGLVSGVVYYFRVRLKDAGNVYSPYSAMATLSFASAPGKPTLTASAVAVQPGEAFQVAWTYETTDTTEQALAIIYDNGVELARVENNSQRMSVAPAWLFGSTHSLTVQTTSASGCISAMSDPVVINVAAAPVISPIDAAITSGITDGVLTEMPIIMTVTGAGEGGQTIIKIERLKDYFVERPDGSVTEGYDGETIYAVAYGGDGELVINPEDLVGSFDDGGEYRLTGIVQDSIGQSASSFLDFYVNWDHQAEAPGATVIVDETELIAKIQAIAPASYEAGDVVDIYRLSADAPELIVEGGSFGNTYVDPYPASGGGYRFVDRTANGDYISDAGVAWTDRECDLILNEVIIDFNNNRLALPYNLRLANDWIKDFEETRYLNGHIAGDWNAGVSRSISINTDIPRDDNENIMMRELSNYAGICHVRTPDGSSFAADIQVSEQSSFDSYIRNYALKITRVDPEGFEGVDEDNYG
ncbi:MAG: hypothetical protein K5886_02835 [Lachnospiraceae bacterium]|nr:hypothetical protein [Lachnospiraceae bacterium]